MGDDFVSIPTGTGADIRTFRDNAGKHHQYFRLEFGAADTDGTPVSAANPMPVDPAVPNADFQVTQVTVGTGAPVQLTPDPLVNRKRLRIQNRGPGEVGIVKSSGLFGASWVLGVGDKEEFDAGPNIDFYGISDTDGNDVRILEY